MVKVTTLKRRDSRTFTPQNTMNNPWVYIFFSIVLQINVGCANLNKGETHL